MTQADQLADSQKAEVVRVVTLVINPQSGFIDAKTHDIFYYHIDYDKILESIFDVNPGLFATKPANHISLLQAGKVDRLAADIAIVLKSKQAAPVSGVNILATGMMSPPLFLFIFAL